VDADEYEKARRGTLRCGRAKEDEPSGRRCWARDGRVHIECSAMATAILARASTCTRRRGPDVPHHENEMRSRSGLGRTFARHWMHVRFLLVEGKKMAKSLGNFYTLRDLLLKGHRHRRFVTCC